MYDDLRKISKEAVMAYSRYYPSTFLEKLKENEKNHSQDSLHPDQDSKGTLLKYKSKMLPIIDVLCRQHDRLYFH
jgi:hypothetical protein